MGKTTGLHRVLVGKLEGKRPPGKCRRRWEENIGMNRKKKKKYDGGVEWTGTRVKLCNTDQLFSF